MNHFLYLFNLHSKERVILTNLWLESLLRYPYEIEYFWYHFWYTLTNLHFIYIYKKRCLNSKLEFHTKLYIGRRKSILTFSKSYSYQSSLSFYFFYPKESIVRITTEVVITEEFMKIVISDFFPSTTSVISIRKFLKPSDFLYTIQLSL